MRPLRGALFGESRYAFAEIVRGTQAAVGMAFEFDGDRDAVLARAKASGIEVMLRAIELSVQQYCPVHAMLVKAFPIAIKYSILEDDGDGGRRNRWPSP